MKITRALLLSSKKQAEAWEVESWGILTKARHYRYLVTDERQSDIGLELQIFRIVRETYTDDRKQERTREKVVDTPHVKVSFEDAGELINFLRRYQIDFEECWQPVED